MHRCFTSVELIYMTWKNTLLSRLRKITKNTPIGKRTLAKQRKTRLDVLVLEDRTVPTTISYTTVASVYTQNFSTLPNAGGTATIAAAASTPGPFDLTQTTPTGNYGASGLNGWYGGDILSGGERFGAGQPSTTTGALFDFNNGTAGSQSLGTISTTTTDSRFGAIFTNNTGSTLTQFTLSYTGEEWWANSGTGTSMEFSYQDLGSSSSALPLGTSGYTTVSQLGFTAPVTQSSGTFENGTLAANQVAVSSEGIQRKVHSGKRRTALG